MSTRSHRLGGTSGDATGTGGDTRVGEIAAALAALLLFGRAVGFGWVYDDHIEVVGNTFITSFSFLPQWFGSTVWAGAGQETFLYRPLALLSYALNYQVSALAPWSYHAVNLLLYAVSAVLVVRLARLWGLSPLGAGIAGLLFAVHPLHVEAVVPVYGRKDLLATAFVLGLALTHRGALERGSWRYVAAPLLFVGAMLSKEVGVVGVALIAVQDIWLEKDKRGFLTRRDLPILYASYLLAAALYLVARAGATGGLGIPDTSPFDNPLVDANVWSRLATAWVVFWKGLGLLALPIRQSPDYSFNAIPLVESPWDLRLLSSVAVTALVAGLASRTGVLRTLVGLGMAWYVLALLPTSNLLVLSGTIFAERLLFLPSVALCVLGGGAAAWAAGRRRRMALAGVAVVLAGLSLQSVRYSSVWTDDLTLFTAATEVVPTSTKAHHRLGEEYLRQGQLGNALRALHRALEVAPGNSYAAATLGTARSHVAARYVDHAQGAGALPTDPAVLYALGAVLLERGDTLAATAALVTAVGKEPTLARAWLTLATIYLPRGTWDEAGEALRMFLRHAGSRYPEERRQATAALARLESSGPD